MTGPTRLQTKDFKPEGGLWVSEDKLNNWKEEVKRFTGGPAKPT
jgi:hypothetical protein